MMPSAATQSDAELLRAGCDACAAGEDTGFFGTLAERSTGTSDRFRA